MAAVVTYAYSVVGITPPTAAQAFYENLLVADVTWADADTTALITHNMNIPTASTPTQHGQNSGSPWVTITQIGNGTVAPVISLTRGTNTITLTKAATITGSNCTVEVQIQRFEPLL